MSAVLSPKCGPVFVLLDTHRPTALGDGCIESRVRVDTELRNNMCMRCLLLVIAGNEVTYNFLRTLTAA